MFKLQPSFVGLLCIRSVQVRTNSCTKYVSFQTLPSYATFLSCPWFHKYTLFHKYSLFYTCTLICDKNVDWYEKRITQQYCRISPHYLSFELVVPRFKVSFMSWSPSCRKTYVLNFCIQINVEGNPYGGCIVASFQKIVFNQFGDVIMFIIPIKYRTVPTKIFLLVMPQNHYRIYLLWLFCFIIAIAVVHNPAGHHSLRKASQITGFILITNTTLSISWVYERNMKHIKAQLAVWSEAHWSALCSCLVRLRFLHFTIFQTYTWL